MIENNYTHLLYVREYSLINNEYELNVYGVNTKDIYHTIGEYYSRSMMKVERIDWTKCTDDKIKYWEDDGYTIRHFSNIHDYGEEP